MTNHSINYPATPQNIDAKILEPSPSFKREVVKVLFAILFFICVYVILLAAAIALAALCAAAVWR